MGKRLNKSGLIVGIGLLGLLMLIYTGSSYAKTSFKNTPLYRHVVKRRNSQPVKLYENKPTASDEQVEVAETSSDVKVIVAEKGKPATPVSPAEPPRPRRVPVAGRSPVTLADPSAFKPDMPFREAVDILRNSTFPKLNIIVLWKDLEENADIYPDTPIGIDGVTGVSISRHLKSLLDGVSGGAQEKLGYVVDEGVVVVSTLGSLPKKMVTHIYDITDLVGQPAQYGGMQGIMMGRIVGMMSGAGMMGGGMMGGGMMGGLGGGYGMQGGMMPGLGGGYGNFGGGFGTTPGLAGTPYTPFR